MSLPDVDYVIKKDLTNEIDELYIEVTTINSTADYIIYKEITKAPTNDVGELFKRLQKKHGRCVSKVYVDITDDVAYEVGWVFEKNMSYTDVDETYTQETWVSLVASQPTLNVTYYKKESE